MKLKLAIKGMHCNGCRMTLIHEFEQNKNIKKIDVDLDNQCAYIDIPDDMKESTIKSLVKDAGFTCTSVTKI